MNDALHFNVVKFIFLILFPLGNPTPRLLFSSFSSKSFASYSSRNLQGSFWSSMKLGSDLFFNSRLSVVSLY